MSWNKPIATKLGIAVLAGSLSFVSAACDMHGGFGFSPLGGGHAGFSARLKPQPVSDITLIHMRKMQVATGQKANLDIRYQALFRYKDIKLNYSASEHVTLLEEGETELPAGSGRRRLSFVTDVPGEHEITLTVSALEYDKPVEITRKIRVFAKTKES